MRQSNLRIALLAFVLSGLLAAPALASSSAAIADCNANGHLTASYSRADLQGALSGMGADVKEYTNCYDVIRRALLAAAAGGGHGSSGGGSSPSGGGGPSATVASVHRSHRGTVSTRGVYSAPPNAVPAGPGRAGAVSLGNANVSPSAGGVSAGAGTRSLPGVLIVLLILLGLVALSGGGVAIRRRVLTRNGA